MKKIKLYDDEPTPMTIEQWDHFIQTKLLDKKWLGTDSEVKIWHTQKHVSLDWFEALDYKEDRNA